MWLMVCRWPQSQEGGCMRETQFVQVSTTWALTCPETVHQRPCMTRGVDVMYVTMGITFITAKNLENRQQESCIKFKIRTETN